MAERQVKVEFIGDAGSLKGATDEAAVAVKRLADEYENGAIDATKFVAEVNKISPELGQVAAAAKMAEDSVNRLDEAAAKGPRALTRETALSVQSIIRLEDAIAKAKAAGAPISPNALASVDALKVKVEAAGVAARKTADALGDLKTRSDLTAKGMESVAGSAGSFEGMLAALKDTSGKTGQALANIGFATVGVAAAFGLGFEVGQKLRSLYQEFTGKEMPSLTNWFVRLGTGVADASGKFDHHGVAAKSLIGRHNELKMGIAASADAMRAAIPTYDAALKAIQEQSAGVDSFKKSVDKLISQGGDLHTWLKTLPPAMGAWAVEIVKSREQLEKLAGAQRDAITELARHELASHKNAEAQLKLAQSYRDAMEANSKAIQKEIDAIASAQASADAARRNAEEKMKALREEDVSLEEFSRRKREIYAEMDRVVAESSKKEEAAEKAKEEAYTRGREVLKKHNEELAEQNKLWQAIAEQGKHVTGVMQEIKVGYEQAGGAVKTYGTEMATAAERASQLEHRHRLVRLEGQALNDTFEDGAGKIHMMDNALEKLDNRFVRLAG